MLTSRVSLSLGLFALLLSAGCSQRGPAVSPKSGDVAASEGREEGGRGDKGKVPSGQPPSPASVTKKHPGGDAADPHYAALLRQKESHWGWKSDKDAQARFPLPDRKNWTRIRLFMVDHFTAFKYGEEEHAVSAAFLVSLKADDPRTSAACVQRFEEQALPKVGEFGGKVSDIKTGVRSWNQLPLVVRQGTGKVDIMFKHYDAALAWTGYPAYEGTCLIYSVAVPWHGHKELAESVRNVWVKNFKRFIPLTENAPYRH